MIEAFHYTDELGFSAWRARGHTARTLPDLAAMLGVEVDELHPRPDPVQYAEEQRQLRRERMRGSTKGANFDPFTGR